MVSQYNYHDFQYKRHLTLEQAEALKARWDHEDEDEQRTSRIIFKKKTNDYTVVIGRSWNS